MIIIFLHLLSFSKFIICYTWKVMMMWLESERIRTNHIIYHHFHLRFTSVPRSVHFLTSLVVHSRLRRVWRGGRK